jgi:hypothetical protein
MPEEQWRTIPEFPMYEISDRGSIYNTRSRQLMRVSQNNFGHMKITLTDIDSRRYTRSVALLVAEAFVVSPNYMSDQLIMLDGDLENVDATNLAWRPRTFAWKYCRQLKLQQPIHYHNLRVRNVTTGREYSSIVEAGMKEGLLFENIWESTYRGTETYPNHYIFEIIERV